MLVLAPFAMLLAVSFPWSTGAFEGVAIAVGWSLAASLLVAWLIRAEAILIATVVAAFVLAYSQGVGDAVAEGASIDRLTASPDATLRALGTLLLFLVGTSLIALGVRSAGRRVRPRAEPADPQSLQLAVAAFVVVTFVAAVLTGFWSFWGGTRFPNSEFGTIRVELSYPPALLLAVAHIAYRRLDSSERQGPRGKWLQWGVYVVLAILFFTLQSRRLMVASGMILGFSWILGETRRARTRREAGMIWRALFLRLAALGGVLLVFAVASSGWRTMREGEELSLTDRFERAVASVGDTSTSFQSIESRLTYLWFDAMTQDLAQGYGAALDGEALLASTTARAVPRLLMPNKDEIPNISCEAGLEGFGLPEDLPCTPTAEGLLIGGYWGVFLAALLWGLGVGASEHFVRQGGLQRVFGLVLIFPFIMLEEGVFAIIPGIRGALVAIAFVAAFQVLARFVRIRRNPTQAPRVGTGER